jgi:SnoaL-like domain
LRRSPNSRAFLPVMSMNLPPIIQKYIDASNAHDVGSILACFADDAIVRDENETRSGKHEIERWLTTTIQKYNFRSKPLGSHERDNETVVSVEISGTFPGSPISLDYHFVIGSGKIALLTIDS